MRRATKLAVGLASAGTTWVVGLVVAGYAARGCVVERTTTRLGESLDATVALEDLELSLVRGQVGLGGLVIDREHDGHLHVRIDRIDAGIAPLGAYLWNRDLGQVTVAGVDIEVTAWAVLKIKPPKRKPMVMDHLTIDGARVVFAPTSVTGDWGKATLQVTRAEAGPTILRTPMSWLFALERLDASLDLPGIAPVTLHFEGGRLEASGSVFGATPIAIDVTLPVPEPGHEGRQLADLGADLAERLALARAERLLRRVLP
ncbi:MAG: hypothetical protein K8W52_33090 [Deltaproteobacteria bacterium]|nr:hypothetical protein [Deltaproteobacteria bacterium]